VTIQELVELEPRIKDLAYLAYGVACASKFGDGIDLALWHRDVTAPLARVLGPDAEDGCFASIEAFELARVVLLEIAQGGQVPDCLVGEALRARRRMCEKLNRGELTAEDWEYQEAELERVRVRKWLEFVTRERVEAKG